MYLFFLIYLIMIFMLFLFFFKQKTAYEITVRDWSSDVCSSDLSWITLLSPWPVWRIAVMLGGGMTITYGARDESARAVNTSRSSQRWYRRRSTACGSYWGG